MADYNSAYTGEEIDAAIGAVKNKEATWDNKQDALIGAESQIVGFDEYGTPVAIDKPSSSQYTLSGTRLTITVTSP